MAIFGAPVALEDHAVRACLAAPARRRPGAARLAPPASRPMGRGATNRANSTSASSPACSAAALGAPEGRGLARRQDRAGQRRQPVDHRRGRARRRPRLARARRRRADRRRHGARRRPAARRAPGRRPRASRCAWSSTRAWRRRPTRASSQPPGAGAGLRRAVRRRRAPAALEARGAEVALLPGAERQGRPGGHAAPTWRGAASTNCMSKPATSSTARCVREGLVDEFLVYLAPKLLGSGREHGRASGRSQRSTTRRRCAFHSVDAIGADLRILRAAVPGRDRVGA